MSEVLDFIEVCGVVTGGGVAHGRWRTESEISEAVKFIAVARGEARLRTDGVTDEVVLRAGDVAMLNGRHWLRLEGGPDEGIQVRVEPPLAGTYPAETDADAGGDALFGGTIEFNAAGREILLATLPPLLHFHEGVGSGLSIRGRVGDIFEEMRLGRPGSSFAIRQHATILVLEMIRGTMADPDLPPGWLKVLHDDRLRPALLLLHDDVARNWTLPELADAASMSRSAFAERFRRIAGVPPHTYLRQWRMLAAQRSLTDANTPLRALARQTGYSSESAFSAAFKQHVGESPRQFRRRVAAAG